jgi:hypothetical protein
MAKKLKISSPSSPRIRHSGATYRVVRSDEVQEALRAETFAYKQDVGAAPISLSVLREDILTRVRSTGGRPALEGATRIQKIPLAPEDWTRLEEIAAHLSREGSSATAGQVASLILHRQLEYLSATRSRRAGEMSPLRPRGR